MQISARNRFAGTVKAIRKGAVMAHVEIDIGGGAIVHSAIFADSVDALGLKPGDKAYAIVKSTDVLVATE